MREIKLPGGVWKYDPDTLLGDPGGFGSVYAGYAESGDEVAIKILHLSVRDAKHKKLQIAIAKDLVVRDLQHIISVHKLLGPRSKDTWTCDRNATVLETDWKSLPAL